VTLQTAPTAIALRRLVPTHLLEASPESHTLAVSWASCEEEVRQAQRLRYRVFALEMGARLTPTTGMIPGLDVDKFDPFCDHLLVKAVSRSDDDDGLLVGTYRVLAPGAARRAGGLYIDTEFDLTPLSSLRSRAVELGRSCVHPAWRSGGVILALWSALCRYMYVHRLETMIGCASVGLKDGGQSASDLWRSLRLTHLVEPEWQVQPRIALPMVSEEEGDTTAAGRGPGITMPPLVKGYLRCGARLLGPPALDEAFNTADLPMLLHLSDLAPRYRKHFLGH
jgi:putative hemolysin